MLGDEKRRIMLTRRHSRRGFTMIEVMVSVAILSVLVMLAAPSLASYSENAKVRSVAESFLASAQVARLEAIRTNQKVELLLTTDAPTAANKGTSNTSATAGNWMVRAVSDDATPVYTFVEGKSVREGSNRTDASSSVSVNASTVDGPLATITFQSAGSTSLGKSWMVRFGSTTDACTASGGSVKCLQVNVTVSGQMKVCDPAITAANDTRRCS